MTQASMMDRIDEIRDLVERVRTSGVYDHRELEDLTTSTPVSIGTLKGAFKAVEAREHQVLAVIVNAKDYAGIRMFGRDHLDIECLVSFLRKGLMATLDGVLVMTDRAQPVAEVMVLGELRDSEGHLLVSAQDIQVIRVIR